MKLTSITLIAVVGVALGAWGQREDKIRFYDGDVLTGTVVSLVPGDGLRFRSPEAADELRLSLENLGSIQFIPAEKNDLDDPHRLILVNGNVLSGRILNLSDAEFTLETTAAGIISVKREMVASVTTKKDRKTVVYAGPNSLDEWEVHSGDWAFDDGVLSVTHGGSQICRTFTLPEKIRIEFEMTWQQNLNTTISVLSDRADATQAPKTVAMQMNNYKWNFSSHGNQTGGQDLSVQVYNLMLNVPVKCTFLIDRKKRNMIVFINGTLVQSWKYDVAFDDPKSNISIMVQSNGFALRDFRVEEWDGKTGLEDKVGIGKTETATVVLENKNRISGTIQSMNDAQIKLQTEFTIMEIPMEKVQAVQLKTEGRAQAEDISGTSVLKLVNGDTLNLKVKWLDADGLVGESEAFGEIRFSPGSLSRLVLDEDDQRHKKKDEFSRFFNKPPETIKN
jgi:hypothetical protein